MKIDQIYCNNSLRNFNYIISCRQTNEAIVIDPLNVQDLIALINKNKYKITKIVNTHEHNDHTDGNLELADFTGADVYCHHKIVNKVPGAKYGLKKDDIIKIGTSLELKVLDTPGHTHAHVCLLGRSTNTNKYNLFCGDTLFNAGAGHCYHGSMDDLYHTFSDILYKLPNDTGVYPGHDYIENNLNFTLSIDPENQFAKELLTKIKKLDKNKFFITNLEMEKKINTFFRLDNRNIINNLIKQAKITASNYSAKNVFIALRLLRNEW